MASVLKRLVPRTQLNPIDNMVEVTVPADTTWVVKSIYVRNQRTDSQAVTHNMWVVPSGTDNSDATWNSPRTQALWDYGQVVTPGEVKTIEYNLLVLHEGDKLQWMAHEATGTYVEVHGLEIT